MDLAIGSLAPLQMQRIEIPMAMPRAGIGNYEIAGQVGTSASGQFGTTSQTYPWGLFLLNAVAIGIAAWGLRRRRHDRPATALSTVVEDPAEATIDLDVLDGWFSHPRRVPGLT